MNTREIATEYRLTHWAQIMHERTESGLSIKAFCETSGIHENVYFYWQRKLREAACEAILSSAQKEISAGVVTQGLVARSASLPAPPGWAAVSEVTEAETGNNAVVIEIGKSRITARAGVDAEHLAKVCRVLVSIC